MRGAAGWWFGSLVGVAACGGGGDTAGGELTIGPAELDFGLVGVGATGELELTVANGGDADVSLLSVTLVEGDPEVFSVDRAGVSVVPAGGSAVILALFEPQDQRAYAGELQIRTDDPDLGTVAVALLGTGGPSEADADQDGFSPAGGDCDDGDPAVNPSAAEVCDGQDTDCDGVLPPEEADGDGDGWLICEADCDDAAGDRNPGLEEACDGGVDNDCDPSTLEDVDGDGDDLTVCDGDCDDAEPRSWPGNPEACGDGVDNDCSGAADDLDADGDGRSGCTALTDCDDDDPAAYPIVVSPKGSAAGTGGDLDPVDSLVTALGLLDRTCRTILLEPGTYPGVSVDWTAGRLTVAGRSGAPGDAVLQAAADARHFTVTGGSLELVDLTLTGGAAAEDGGAVRVTNGSLELSGVVARQNRSALDGGAIAVLSGSLTLRRGCRFEDNEAGEDGGAVQVDAATLEDRGSAWTGNRAPAGQGGALSVNGGSVAVTDAEFRANSADEGGAVAILNSGSFLVERSWFASNAAAHDGGALSFRDVSDAGGFVRNNRVQDNTAGGAGGGAAFVGYGGALQVVNNTFTGNDALGEGALAVVVTGSSPQIVLAANVLVENDGPSAIYTAPGSGAAVVYNTAHQQQSGVHFAGACGDGSGGPDDPTNAVRNPLLGSVSDDQDPTNDDLSLRAGSPEIDSGPPGPALADPDGSPNDRGFTGGPAAVP